MQATSETFDLFGVETVPHPDTADILDAAPNFHEITFPKGRLTQRPYERRPDAIHYSWLQKEEPLSFLNAVAKRKLLEAIRKVCLGKITS